jgi:drug/metabolite transporter (DMT)-like permease
VAGGVHLALGAMLCYGLVDWVYKRAAGLGVPAHQMLMAQALFFAPGMYGYALLTGTLVAGASFLWGMAAGLFIFVALYAFNRSLADGAVSVVAPVFRLSFAITAALAVWLLDEPLDAWRIAGLGAALAAVVLLVGGGPVAGSAGGKGRLRGRALLQVAIATVAMGLVSFFYKLGAAAGGGGATVLCGQAAVFAPLAIGVACMRDRGFRVPRRVLPHAATTAFLLFAGVLMLIAGLARGDASVLVPIAQLSFVVTALLGLVVLREPLTPRKAAGLACAIAALVCLAA